MPAPDQGETAFAQFCLRLLCAERAAFRTAHRSRPCPCRAVAVYRRSATACSNRGVRGVRGLTISLLRSRVATRYNRPKIGSVASRSDSAMKRHAHWWITLLAVLTVFYDLAVWGALADMAEVGDKLRLSARRQAFLATVYMAGGEVLDRRLPPLRDWGAARVESAFDKPPTWRWM
jgi:hypothetical protein